MSGHDEIRQSSIFGSGFVTIVKSFRLRLFVGKSRKMLSFFEVCLGFVKYFLDFPVFVWF